MAAARVEVPEPSPLFWEHLSERVREAVAVAGAPRGVWRRPSTWPPRALPAAAALAAVGLAALLASRGPARISPASAPEAVPVATASWVEPADDPSLNLVADLAAQIDGDAASDLIPPPHAGGASDDLMGELSAGERVEMRRLLQAELARPGA
jgi:hypothetical protein